MPSKGNAKVEMSLVSSRNSKKGFPGSAVVKNPPAGLPWWRSG